MRFVYRIRRVAFLGLVGLLLPVLATAQNGFSPGRGKEFTQDRADGSPRGLPVVLLIGDSICAGYAPYVTKQLEGKATVIRSEAGGPTTQGLDKLPAELQGREWAVIHFNWGLHDIKILENGQYETPLQQYQTNLRQLVRLMKETGAHLIWATTTPVPHGKLNPMRNPGDEVKYNKAAAKIMRENGIATDDLYSFALPRLSLIQQPTNVHYTPEGYSQLAGQVVESIRAVLQK
jgi:lysophospholipase L1-like esterase